MHREKSETFPGLVRGLELLELPRGTRTLIVGVSSPASHFFPAKCPMSEPLLPKRTAINVPQAGCSLVQIARHHARRSHCWDSTRVDPNPERSQQLFTPCRPSGPGQHRLCEGPHRGRALAPRCPFARQFLRKVVPPRQCLTCQPRK